LGRFSLENSFEIRLFPLELPNRKSMMDCGPDGMRIFLENRNGIHQKGVLFEEWNPQTTHACPTQQMQNLKKTYTNHQT
jgi:hypothetical protein